MEQGVAIHLLVENQRPTLTLTFDLGTYFLTKSLPRSNVRVVALAVAAAHSLWQTTWYLPIHSVYHHWAASIPEKLSTVFD